MTASVNPNKVCPKCDRLLPLESFYVKAKTGRPYSYCKDCSRRCVQEHRDRDIERARRKSAEYTKAWRTRDPVAANASAARNRKKKQARVSDLKTSPCVDCGGTFPPYVMDFDHRDRNEKVKPISRLIDSGARWDTIAAEIAKCDLVCANCHRVRTHTRGDYSFRRAEGGDNESCSASS